MASPVDLAPAPTGTGVLQGEVVFTGEVPPPGRSAADSFPECRRAGAPPGDPALQVNGGKVKNAYVYVKSGLPPGSHPPPTASVVIDQKGCEFEPRVAGVRVGQKVEILNSDALLHNVHANPKATPRFNLAMPMKGSRIERTFHAPEVMVELRCDVHGWMRAYVGVQAHPYFAVTGADGAFRIEGLPDGEYDVEVWHERLGAAAQKIAVSGGQSAPAQFSFSAMK